MAGSEPESGSQSASGDALAQLLRQYLGIEAPPTTVGAGDSLEETYAAGHDALAVRPDYDDSVESWPVELDVPADRTLHVIGAGPMATTLGASATVDGGPLLRVIGAGADQYGAAPTIAGLGLLSGAPALELQACPHAAVRDCYAEAAGTAFRVAPAASGAGTYGTAWTNCQAWNGGGHGFALATDAAPHGATFLNCHAVANRGHGYALRGTNWRVANGSAQLNYGWGVEARGGMSGHLDGVYIEGNARGADNNYPVEVYGDNHDGARVGTCYCHGIYPRATEHDFDRVQRALNVHDSERWGIEDCTFRRYEDAALAFFDGDDIDVRAPSHLCRETDLVSTQGDAQYLSYGEEWTGQ